MGGRVVLHILLRTYGRICALCVGIVNIIGMARMGRKTHPDLTSF